MNAKELKPMGRKKKNLSTKAAAASINARDLLKTTVIMQPLVFEW